MDGQPVIPGSESPTTRYERLLPLGVGGMATVHLALAIGQNGFNRLVVLKSVREGLPESPQMRQMFVNEAQLTARLNHPNIVQAFEVIETHDTMVLVMEYLDGLSLTEAYRAARHELSVPMRLRIVAEVLTGLHYAHDHTDFQGTPLGIVHRDVTPTNVFVTYDGRVKLLDFGIAKMTAAEDRTRTGMVKGKLAYMPPEQLAGRTIDRRTDIYAVGCLLWEAIAGSRMWEGRTEADIARSLLSGKVPPLSSRVMVDPALERIVTQATAAEPDARYPTAAAMRDDLEDFMASMTPTLTRDVGQMLASVCADARADRQRKIAHAIRTVEATLARERSDASAPPVSSEAPTQTSLSGTSALTGSPTGVARPKRFVRPLVLAPLILLVGTLVWSQWPRGSATRRTASSARTAPSAPAAPRLMVQAMPSAARVFVNGARVTGVPATLEVPPKTTHTVRVELEGHQTAERRMRVDSDTLISIELVPAAAVDAPDDPASGELAPVAPPQRDAARSARKPSSAPSPSRVEGRCNPPYYFSGGIKTYKPECI